MNALHKGKQIKFLKKFKKKCYTHVVQWLLLLFLNCFNIINPVIWSIQLFYSRLIDTDIFSFGKAVRLEIIASYTQYQLRWIVVLLTIIPYFIFIIYQLKDVWNTYLISPLLTLCQYRIRLLLKITQWTIIR